MVLAGDSYADAKAHCDLMVTETGLTFIHPFDDPLVIAGQGTIGLKSCSIARTVRSRYSCPLEAEVSSPALPVT